MHNQTGCFPKGYFLSVRLRSARFFQCVHQGSGYNSGANFKEKIMTTVGILSDTHLQTASESFMRLCAFAFADCETIIHAGDLTDSSVLNAFKGKDIHAVHGNMCNTTTKQVLPEVKQIVLAGYSIAITHGAGQRQNIEERVFERFPTADCIVFGHTHEAVCRKFGRTLLINPGSFLGTGRYGAAGTYALLTIDKDGLNASIQYPAKNRYENLMDSMAH